MSASVTKRKAGTSNTALGAVDVLGSQLVAEAEARATRLRNAAGRYHKGREMREQAAALDGLGAAEQDEAITLMSDELDATKVATLLDLSTRAVSDAVRRHRSKAATPPGESDDSTQGTGGGLVAKTVDVRDSATAESAREELTP